MIYPSLLCLKGTEAITVYHQRYRTISWNVAMEHPPCTVYRLVWAKIVRIVRPGSLNYVITSTSSFHMYHLHTNLALCACVALHARCNHRRSLPLGIFFIPTRSFTMIIISSHSSFNCSICLSTSILCVSISILFASVHIPYYLAYFWFDLPDLLPRTLLHSCLVHPIPHPFDSSPFLVHFIFTLIP